MNHNWTASVKYDNVIDNTEQQQKWPEKWINFSRSKVLEWVKMGRSEWKKSITNETDTLSD